MYKTITIFTFLLFSTSSHSFAPFTLGKISRCAYYHQESVYDENRNLISQTPKIFYFSTNVFNGADCPYPPQIPGESAHDVEDYELEKVENGISYYGGTTPLNEDCAIEAIRLDIIFD